MFKTTLTAAALVAAISTSAHARRCTWDMEKKEAECCMLENGIREHLGSLEQAKRYPRNATIIHELEDNTHFRIQRWISEKPYCSCEFQPYVRCSVQNNPPTAGGQANAYAQKGTNGREGFCAGVPPKAFKACVNADRGATKRHFSPEAHEACFELAEYVNAKERRQWERCLAKHDRAIKGG